MSSPADPSTRRVLVLLNRHSGTLANSTTQDEPTVITAGLAAAGLEADVRAVEYDGLKQLIQEVQERQYAAVLVGGGDGTVNAVANAVAGSQLPFGVLPLGTHNHFAKEMNVPLDLAQAVEQLARAIGEHRVHALDVAQVNDHIFLNFSGIGLHPTLVEQREQEHEQIKRFALLRKVLRRFTKPLALLVAFIKSLRDLPVLRLWVEYDGQRHRRTTPSLLVVTNVHQMEVFGLKDLSVPRRGVLNVYTARSRTVTSILRLVLAALTRRLAAMRDFETVALTELTIHNRRPTLQATVDGEVVRLRTPLRYRICPGAIQILETETPATT